MIPDSMIVVPSCKRCHDWMLPAMLWVWPVDAVVWICLNGCGAYLHGSEHPGDEDVQAMAVLTATLMGGRQ